MVEVIHPATDDFVHYYCPFHVYRRTAICNKMDRSISEMMYRDNVLYEIASFFFFFVFFFLFKHFKYLYNNYNLQYLDIFIFLLILKLCYHISYTKKNIE